MKRSIIYWLMIALSASLLLLSCQDSAIKPEDNGSHDLTSVGDFPLTEGTRWDYVLINNLNSDTIATLGVQVVDLAGNPAYGSSESGFPFMIMVQPTSIFDLNEFNEYMQFELKPYLPFAGIFGDTIKASMDTSGLFTYDWMIFPLQPGKTWTTLINNPLPGDFGSESLMVVSRVLDTVNVIVPAGSFLKAYRLQRNYFINDQPVYVEDLEDFYPNVGLVNIRLREIQRKSAAVLHDYRLELVRYTIK
jgi:hypothetical protein